MKKIPHNIIAQYRRLVNHFFKRINTTLYFKNRYGVKAYNKSQFKISINDSYSIIGINPEEIYLGFDALKNEYTYLDTRLPDSPHVDLIRHITNNEDIYHTRYVQDEIAGRLDGRYELVDNHMLVTRHYECAKTPTNKEYPIVYVLNQRYYVIDGKHRLSMAFLNKETNVLCIIIPLQKIANHSYTIGIFNKMKKVGDCYSKNLEHLREMMKCVKVPVCN